MNAPVILFSYKRTALTKRVLDALSGNFLAPDTEVFVFANTCKSGDKDEAKVAETHKMLLEYKGEFKRYTVVLREKPLSVKETMMSALDDIFKKYDRVIVLEDDIMPSKNFLNFMNDALEKYDSDEDMFSVCGYSPIKVECLSDSYKSLIFRSWGYALWREKYKKADFLNFENYLYNIDDIHQVIREIPTFFPFFGSYTFFLTEDYYLDTLLIAYQFSQHKYTLFPKESLCVNICDGDSTSKINSSLVCNYGYNIENSKVLFQLENRDVSRMLDRIEYNSFVNCGNWNKLVIIEQEHEATFYRCLKMAIIWCVFNNISGDYFFRKHKIRRIAVYACGECGKLLYRFLKDSDFVEIVYAMDRDIDHKLSDAIPTFQNINKELDVDAVIVTYVADFNAIRLSLDFDDHKIFDVLSIMIETQRDFKLHEKMLPYLEKIGGK